MRDPHQCYAQDPRTSEELLFAVKEARKRGDENEVMAAVAILHYRGGEQEFQMGKTLAESSLPEDREIGAFLLGQLGFGKTFLDESIPILIGLLEDENMEVVSGAAFALGHRKDPRAIPALISKASHNDPDVRWGVVFGLGGHDDDRAIQTLIALCSDPDFDVRNWAVFSLGSLTVVDTSELREALVRALIDDDPEIRGEALIGLANRGDPRVIQPLKKELGGSFYGSWSLEAVEKMALPEFKELLEVQFKTLDDNERKRFSKDFEKAIAACNSTLEKNLE